MSQGRRISGKDAGDLLERLKAGVVAGKLETKTEPNQYLVWRFDGSGAEIRCYTGRRGLTLHTTNEEVLGHVQAGRFNLLADIRGTARGTRAMAYGHLEVLERSSGPETSLPREPVRKKDLSDDQKLVFEEVLAWARKKGEVLLTLGGYAGTGKTTLAALFARELATARKLAFCAYTGKAANVLRQKLAAAGVDIADCYCGTIHGLIYRPVVDGETGELIEWSRQNSLAEDIVIVDEASMVGREIWDDLTSYGKKILALGDHGQLPPVGTEQINLIREPLLRLEKVHRQAEQNPILQFAAWVREGRPPEEFVTSADPRLRILRGLGSDAEVLADCFEAPEDPEQTVVLCRFNRTRVGLNGQIRGRLGFETGDPVVGDTVVCLRNARLGKGAIFNGMRGLIERVAPDDEWGWKASVRFADDGLRLKARLNRSQFGREQTFISCEQVAREAGAEVSNWSDVGLLFDYGYALTVHKSQGSQYRRVIIRVEPPIRAGEPDEPARWLYTAATRAVQELVVVLDCGRGR